MEILRWRKGNGGWGGVVVNQNKYKDTCKWEIPGGMRGF